WVKSVISPLREFIDMPINPRHHYLDLQEIADGPGGTTLYVARLADTQRDRLTLPTHVAARDQLFVAIKSVPIMPTGSSKLVEVLRELRIMRHIQCENILGMDALYVDPVEDTLWIRMELMTRTLSSVIELNAAGLVLSDRMIAGCTKDILTALEYLRVHRIVPRNIRAENVLLNNHGVLKLTNLSNAVTLPTSSRHIHNGLEQSMDVASARSIHSLIDISDTSALGALVWEMATGTPPSLDAQKRLEDWPPLSLIASHSPAFHEFIRMCFDPAVGSFGYRRLIDSAFISDACERPTLAQLLLQCTAFEGRLREQRRAR
ncbi:kinase-like domain-containing protein, partial [Mycena rosella]